MTTATIERPRPVTRGTSNSNSRGSSKDRAARKMFLLVMFGDGTTCPCCFCGCELTYDTLSVDRIVPGIEGGRYTRDNIRPSCQHCNSSDGAYIGLARRQLAMAG